MNERRKVLELFEEQKDFFEEKIKIAKQVLTNRPMGDIMYEQKEAERPFSPCRKASLV